MNSAAEDKAEHAAALSGSDGKQCDADPDEEQREHRDGARGRRSCRGLVDRRHHHPAGRVLEDVVDRVPEDRALTPADILPRRPDDDDLGAAALGLANDLGACVPAAHESRDHRDAVRVADRAGLVELAVRAPLLLRQLCRRAAVRAESRAPSPPRSARPARPPGSQPRRARRPRRGRAARARAGACTRARAQARMRAAP